MYRDCEVLELVPGMALADPASGHPLQVESVHLEGLDVVVVLAGGLRCVFGRGAWVTVMEG